ncbi:tyrosine--tRNA ligase, partial [Salmonella enterica]
PETVAGWVRSIQDQVRPYISFEGENAAQMVNNLDWTQGITAIEFLRDIGKYFRVGTMIKKDLVAKRLNSDEGI